MECELAPPHPSWDRHKSLGQQTSRSPASHLLPTFLGSKEHGHCPACLSTTLPSSTGPRPSAPSLSRADMGRKLPLGPKIRPCTALMPQNGDDEFGFELVPVLTVWGQLRAQDPGTEALGTPGPARLPQPRSRPGSACVPRCPVVSSETQAGPCTFPDHDLC